MTPERMNLRIAVACGWKQNPNYIGDLIWVWERGDVRLEITEIKNYTTDLNAMHEAEKTLSIGDKYYQLGGKGKYITQLLSTVNDAECSTALQRAEAFCRTVPCAKCGLSIWDCEQTECKGGI